MPPQVKEQFMGMSERFLGADPSEQRKHFDIKVLRHNNPLFGPKTRTISMTPKGKAILFSRMEEDIDGDGLALATRIYDGTGEKSVTIKALNHRSLNGFPVADVMQATSQTPAGETTTTISCRGVEIE